MFTLKSHEKERETKSQVLTYDRGGLPVVDSGWAWSCHDSYRGGASENFAPPRAKVAAPKLPFVQIRITI